MDLTELIAMDPIPVAHKEGALTDEEQRELYDSVIEIRDSIRTVIAAAAQFQEAAKTNPMLKMMMGQMGIK